MNKRMYRSVGVKDVDVSAVLSELPAGQVWIGVDVGKEELYAVVRDSNNKYSRPWCVKQPSELREFVDRVRVLARSREATVVMESTGTNGDALRQALADAGVRVARVRGKVARDYSEVFDGVPSQHDGKDAAILAELAAHGKSREWAAPNNAEWVEQLRCDTSWLTAQRLTLQQWLGRLESLLARHWPEASALLKPKTPTMQMCLMEYGGSAKLAADPEAAARLKKWGGHHLTVKKVQALIGSAQSTVGVRMDASTERLMKQTAQAAFAAHGELLQTGRRLGKMVRSQPVLQRMAEVVGVNTAAVLFATVGHPGDFDSGPAYRKSLGLNLKERSSGKHQGQLRITKRGSSEARRWLFYAALRLVQQRHLKGWFEAKKRKDGGRSKPAVVAIMRRLPLALYAVVERGQPFSMERFKPGVGRLPKRESAAGGALGALPPNPRDLSREDHPRESAKRVGKRDVAVNATLAPAATPIQPAASVPAAVPTPAVGIDRLGTVPLDTRQMLELEADTTVANLLPDSVVEPELPTWWHNVMGGTCCPNAAPASVTPEAQQHGSSATTRAAKTTAGRSQRSARTKRDATPREKQTTERKRKATAPRSAQNAGGAESKSGGTAARGAPPPKISVTAPGTALELVPTSALSSAQVAECSTPTD